jgi:tRNA (adenine22-N1)-methyltransferase
MISLSKRLSVIAEMVPSCGVLADVGTDHGYLPVYLLQQGSVKRVLASDIHLGPLRKARETAEQFGLSDRMETILADGLQFPGSEQAEVITICGMGGETMISILEAAPWAADHRRLILQPQSKLPELEEWLKDHQFSIDDARLCLDGGKLYLAFSVLGGAEWKRNAEETLSMKQDVLFPKYVQREYQKAKRARDGLMKSSGEHADMVFKLEQRIKVLEHYEKEILKW